MPRFAPQVNAACGTMARQARFCVDASAASTRLLTALPETARGRQPTPGIVLSLSRLSAGAIALPGRQALAGPHIYRAGPPATARIVYKGN